MLRCHQFGTKIDTELIALQVSKSARKLYVVAATFTLKDVAIADFKQASYQAKVSFFASALPKQQSLFLCEHDGHVKFLVFCYSYAHRMPTNAHRHQRLMEGGQTAGQSMHSQ